MNKQKFTVCFLKFSANKTVKPYKRMMSPFYHTFFDLAPYPMAITDFSNGRVVDVNQAFVSWSLYSREELIGYTTIELGIWPDNESRKVIIDRLSDAGRVDNIEACLRRKNGELRQVVISGRLMEAENCKWFLSITQDITELKHSEEELRKSEERFRRITENSKNMIFRMSLPDGKYEYISPAVIDITGYSPEEIYNENLFFRKIIHPNSQSNFIQEWQNIIQGNVPPYSEYKIIHKSGAERWLNQRNILISDNNGRPMAIEGIVTDITERKDMEKQLKESEEKYRALLEYASDAILIVDFKGNFLDVNKRAEKLLGYTKEELLSMHSEQIHPEEEHERLIDGLRRLNEEKVNFLMNAKVLRKDGKTIPVDITAAVVEYGGNRVIQGIFRDITEHKYVEEALQDEREKLLAIINATFDRIYLIDTEGFILAINKAGALYSAMRTDRTVGTNLFDGLTPDVAKKRKVIIQNICLSQQPIHIEYNHDNEWTDSHFFPVIVDGKVKRIVVYGRDITENKRSQEERERLIFELQEAIAKVKTLSGMLPICASCKKIRNDKGYWEQIEVYIGDHSEAEFSHGICPECAEKLYPGFYKK